MLHGLCGQTSAVAQRKTIQQKDAGTPDLTRRIERVENGLLPPAAIKGEPPVPMRIADRMQFYKTPGVSIAVINDGRIEWARGYGVLEAGGKEPVTSATLFQAASIYLT
jgi:CubicO group peptidase (beta-lactamase class C family)